MDNSQFNHDEPNTDRQSKPQVSGVRRVNNMPLLIAGGVLAVFLILVAMVAFDRAAENAKSEQDATEGQADDDLAAQILRASGNRTGGLVDAEADADAIPSLPIAPVDNPDMPPTPPPEDPFLAQLKAAKLAMLQKAIQANTQVGSAMAKPMASDRAAVVATTAKGPDASRTDRPLADELHDLVSDNGRGAGGMAAGLGYEPFALQSGRAVAPDNNYTQFDNAGGEDRWKLDSSVDKPRTPFELRAGYVIPATLMSGVNSELPGQIIAQVSQDVYDTATGKYRLIPQGTRLVGSYNSNVAYGQSRVLIAWQRLVFPDGKAMDIGSMPGADGAGYSGFKDKVNNHYLRIFGSAMLLSGVVAGINSSQTGPDNDPFGSSINTQLSQAIAQQMGQVAVELIRKNINISPTLEIRPGYRFNVMVVKDLTFNKSYQPFDY